jgi:cob(I)alamin adenosyltransferase
MKLYTRTGDDGKTGLFGGERVRKDDPRVVAYGEADEANAAIGLAIVAWNAPVVRERLLRIQETLFAIGSELANPLAAGKGESVSDDDVAELEQWIDEATAEPPPLRRFILPGGGEAAARLHFARTASRRCERAIVSLSASERVHPRVIAYVNRLSDLLFAFARLANHREGISEDEWHPRRGAEAP